MPRRLPPLTAAAATAAVLGALLTGCTAAPEPVTLTAGDCLAASFDNQPDRDSLVACTEPHAFQVVAQLEASPEVERAIEASDAASVYARLVRAEASDELVTAFRSWAMPQCRAALDTVTGLDRLAIEGSDALDVELALPAALVAGVADPARFAAGQRSVVCALAWVDATGTLAPTALPAGTTIAELATGAVPLELRSCAVLAEDGTRSSVACGEPHSLQDMLVVDAATALGVEWITGVDPATGRSDDYRAADTLCGQLVEQLLAETPLAEGLDAWAEPTATEGWASFDGTVAEAERYPVRCSVTAPRGRQFEGDVFAGTASVIES